MMLFNTNTSLHHFHFLHKDFLHNVIQFFMLLINTILSNIKLLNNFNSRIFLDGITLTCCQIYITQLINHFPLTVYDIL